MDLSTSANVVVSVFWRAHSGGGLERADASGLQDYEKTFVAGLPLRLLPLLPLLAVTLDLLRLVLDHSLGTSGDFDLRVLFELGAVLGDEFGRHREARRYGLLDSTSHGPLATMNLHRDLLLDRLRLRRLAQVAISSQRTELALRQRQFEAVYGCVRDMSKGTGGYPRFGYERITDQVNRYAITLQYEDQLWERFIAMAHEISWAFERYRQDRSDRLGVGDYRR
jgi:hypothetical protein